MSDFERTLDRCLEALREGRWTLDECLAQYPQHADALRSQLLTAMAVQARFAEAEPSAEFADRARERFLVASGQRLQEAYDIEPSPSFFAAARVRFLMAAHAMRREGTFGTQPAKQRSRFIPGARALTGLAASLVLFFGFSTYTVATADAALPGDWQYPVKLQSERVRLALALSDSHKREVRLDIAEERAHEIDQLAKHGDRIGSAELRRLKNQTSSLVADAQGGSWDQDSLTRLQDVSEQSTLVLQTAAPQVDPEAQPELVAAVGVSRDALLTATVAITNQPQPSVLNPTLKLSPTPEATETAEASPAATNAVPSSTSATAPTATAVPPTPTPQPTLPPGIITSASPVAADLGILWNRVAVGRFSALVPSPKDGWNQAGGDFSSATPSLLHFSNVDGTSLITLDARTGDMWWYQLLNGRFQETDMRRAEPDGSILLIDPEVLRKIYGPLAEIPLYVLNSITMEPSPAPPPPAP